MRSELWWEWPQPGRETGEAGSFVNGLIERGQQERQTALASRHAGVGVGGVDHAVGINQSSKMNSSGESRCSDDHRLRGKR